MGDRAGESAGPGAQVGRSDRLRERHRGGGPESWGDPTGLTDRRSSALDAAGLADEPGTLGPRYALESRTDSQAPRRGRKLLWRGRGRCRSWGEGRPRCPS
jgi:hypothetical protein